MLDIGFTELMIIGIVALVVIGPERLPKVARTAGHLFGRLQRYVNDVKADISREMQLDELKKLKTDLQDSARSFESSVKTEMHALEQVATQAKHSIDGEVNSSVSTAPATAPERADSSPAGSDSSPENSEQSTDISRAAASSSELAKKS